MKTRSVSFVIPTKNEEATINEVILSVKANVEHAGYILREIVVVDDSEDSTRRLASEAGAIVVSGESRGLGHAMLIGLKRSLQGSPDCVVSLDSDGQVDLSEIPKFIDALDTNGADLVLGSRFLNDHLIEYDYPAINRFGTRVLSWILRRATGLNLTDSHGGIRAMRPEVIKKLKLLGRHTYVQETIIDAHENGFKVIEIPSKWKKRDFGQSRVVRSIPRYVLYTLPVIILRCRPHLKFFLRRAET